MLLLECICYCEYIPIVLASYPGRFNLWEEEKRPPPTNRPGYEATIVPNFSVFPGLTSNLENLALQNFCLIIAH